MGAIIFVIILFLVLVGGGWFIGKLFGNIIFKENNKKYQEIGNIKYSFIDVKKNKIEKENKIRKPNYKIPLEEIILKIQTVKLQTRLNNTSIYFDNITMSNSKYLPMYYDQGSDDYLGLSFKISDRYIVVEIASSNKKITLYKGAELTFYFENNETIKYKFLSGSVKGSTHNINVVIPKLAELELFAFQNLKYWSLKYDKRDLFIQGNNNFFDSKNRMSSNEEFQEILKYLVKSIVEEFTLINKNALK